MEKNITAKIVFDTEELTEANRVMKKMLDSLNSKEMKLIKDCVVTSTVMEVDSDVLDEKENGNEQ